MKVALLSRFALPYHNYGGLERHLYHLLKHLLLNGVEVYLFIQKPFHDSNLFDSYPNFHPVFIDYFRLPLGKIKRTIILDRITNYPMLCRKMAKRVVQTALTEKLDIIHAHGLTSFAYAQYKAEMQKEIPPMIMNPHGLEEFKSKNPIKNFLYFPFRRLVRLGARYSQRVIATDRCTAEEVNRYLGVAENKVVILANAIDVEECLAFINEEVKKELIEKFPLSNRSIIFLSVGRLERNKGYHILIKALARIKDRLPANWCWILVGKGSDRGMLEQRIKDFGLYSNIIMAGSLDDYQLHNLYCAFEDLFKIVADYFENTIEDRVKYHSELLRRMSIHIEGIRPSLLTDEAFGLLDGLRGFRHFFRHAYGYEIDPRKVKIVLEDALRLKGLYKDLVANFIEKLA